MMWLHDLSYFLGGAFLANAIPHYVSGVLGRPFQSPFATPSGKGLSSSTVNIVWGFANLVVAYLLVMRIGHFDPRATDHIVALGLGLLLMGLVAARLTAGMRRRVPDRTRAGAKLLAHRRPWLRPVERRQG